MDRAEPHSNGTYPDGVGLADGSWRGAAFVVDEGPILAAQASMVAPLGEVLDDRMAPRDGRRVDA